MKKTNFKVVTSNSKRVAVVATVVLLVFTSITGLWAEKPVNNELKKQATGWKPASQEGLEWLDANTIKIKEVKLNKIGLERIKKSKKSKKNLDNAAYAEFGEEIISAATAPIGDATTESTTTTAMTYNTLGSETLPDAIDNSTSQYFPPIRNQGDQGSCVSFAVGYYQLTYMTAMARGWDVKNDLDNTNKFSPKWLYNFTNGALNEGGSEADAFRVMKQVGCATWDKDPYTGLATDPLQYREWNLDTAVWRDAMTYKVKGVGSINLPYMVDTVVTDPDDADLDDIKALLNNGYVLTFGTQVHSWQYDTIKDDAAVTGDDAVVGQRVVLYLDYLQSPHFMTIVGYNDDIWADINNNNVVDPGEKGAFKIANSWGDWWENDGYAWVAYDTINQVSSVQNAPQLTNRDTLFTSNRVYFLTAHASYTPRLTAEVTLNHALRNEILVMSGIANTNESQPASVFDLSVVFTKSGNCAFNGTAIACDATFVFDLTDVAYNKGKNRNYYLTVKDIYTNINKLTIKDFKVIDPVNNVTLTSNETFPILFDYTLTSIDLGVEYVLPVDPALDDTWDLHSTLAQPLNDYGITSLNNKIYLAGGEWRATTYDALNVYDPVADSWTVAAPMPQARKKFSLVTVDNKLFAMGGYNSTGYVYAINAYDPVTDAWSYCIDFPDTLEQAAITECDGKIYFFGGRTDASRVKVYNPVTNILMDKTPLSIVINDARAVSINNMIYLIGGADASGYTNAVYLYDPNTQTVSAKQALPSIIETPSVTVNNDKIYLAGGKYRTNNTNDVNYDVYEYDPVIDTWTIIGKTLNRKDMAIAGISQSLYIIGGSQISAIGLTESVQVSSGGSVDTIPPSVPGDFRATHVTTDWITVAWNTSTDNVALANYELTYYKKGDTPFPFIATVSPTANQISTPSNLTPDTTYVFSIRAKDTSDNVSEWSTIEVTTEPTIPVYPAWSSTEIYLAKDVVSHNGKNWEAQWWTQGEEPGTTGEWGVWREL